jgi:hypothetical protein
MVWVHSHTRRSPRSLAGRARPAGFDFFAAAADALARAERGEQTERELLRDAALAQDPSGDLARRLDVFAAGADDASIKELRAVLTAGRSATEGSGAP